MFAGSFQTEKTAQDSEFTRLVYVVNCMLYQTIIRFHKNESTHKELSSIIRII